MIAGIITGFGVGLLLVAGGSGGGGKPAGILLSANPFGGGDCHGDSPGDWGRKASAGAAEDPPGELEGERDKFLRKDAVS